MRQWLCGTVCVTAILFGAATTKAELIGLYQFDDPMNLGKDTSGHNNNAATFGAAFTASGYQGGAAYFDLASFLRVPIDVNPTALPRMTWGAWAKPIAPAPIRTVLSGDNGDSDRDINIDFRGGTVSWSAFVGNGVLGSGVAPSPTEWTFLAAVYDQNAGSLTFYVNGQSFTTTTVFGASHSFFDIGHNPDYAEYFWGSIDNVFVYDNGLTANQIAQIQNDGFPAAVPEPSSLALLALGGIGSACSVYRRRRIAA